MDLERDGTVERWRRVERVLDLALESDPAQWRQIITDQCGDDEALRLEVERLLARHRTAERFLESPPGATAAALLAEARGDADGLPGHRFGAWRVLREVGRGGMSRVFLAERADGQYEQRAALKLLRPGLDSDVDLARFRAERQIMASLEHPNIARLLDGGVTGTGLPYLVLEYIEGLPIHHYCDARALRLRERLELFLTILGAVQYAHRNLVVHRDLKPSNVLVTTDGTVKLLDFGLARLLEGDAPNAATPTRSTGRWMTPAYAAPEQVRGQSATTATDVYQLGVVLYELLTGRLPFAELTEDLHELERAILEVDPAPPSVAAQRARGDGRDPVGWSGALRGDLDAIVLMAMRKEPERRYPTVQAFADDIRRYLTGHPVLARRQSTAYRLRRFVRRNRPGIAVAALAAALLVSYVGMVLRDRARVQLALREAQLGQERAEQTTDFLIGLFEATEGGRALTDTLTARELLTRGVAQARELTGQPAMQAQMLDVVGRLYTHLGDYDRAEPLLREALEIRRSLHGPEHADVLTSMESVANVLEARQLVDETLQLRRQILALRRELDGDDHPRAVSALWSLAAVLHRKGEYSEADSLFDLWIALVSDGPAVLTPLRARQTTEVGRLLALRGEYGRAEPVLRRALAMNRALYGDRHQYVAEIIGELGRLHLNLDRYAQADSLMGEALEMVRASFPDGHPEVARALRDRAVVQLRAGRFAAAEPYLREALEIHQRIHGPENLEVAMTALDLAVTLTRTGRPREGEALAREATTILRTLLGGDNSMVVYGGAITGSALVEQGRYAEAEPLLLAAYERFRIPRPTTRLWRNSTLRTLARLYQAQGRTTEAERYLALIEPELRETPPAPR